MGENTVLDSLVDENVELVRSGVRVIGSAPAELYRDGHDRIASGGVGRHFRHVLEFYDCLLHCGDGTVDYQARRRDPRVERDAGYAAEAAGRIVTRLDALRTASGDRVLTVASEVHDRAERPSRSAHRSRASSRSSRAIRSTTTRSSPSSSGRAA